MKRLHSHDPCVHYRWPLSRAWRVWSQTRLDAPAMIRALMGDEMGDLADAVEKAQAKA